MWDCGRPESDLISKLFLCFSLRAVARVTDGKVRAGEGEARVQQNVALFLFAPKL